MRRLLRLRGRCRLEGVKPLRRLTRPLLGAIFVVSGYDVMRNPEPRARTAEPVIRQMSEIIPVFPSEPVQAVRLNAAVHLVAGSMLALGILPRLSALTLAGSMIPTTYGGHRFWEYEDKMQRAQQQAHFLKNLAILGGLLTEALT